MKIISKRQTLEFATFEHYFEWNNAPGETGSGGFGFPCNEEGEIEFDSMPSGCTNSCNCGLDYNMSGQQLAPREQWGEETGETVSEILSIR
jgi:hypothetical protein